MQIDGKERARLGAVTKVLGRPVRVGTHIELTRGIVSGVRRILANQNARARRAYMHACAILHNVFTGNHRLLLFRDNEHEILPQLGSVLRAIIPWHLNTKRKITVTIPTWLFGASTEQWFETHEWDMRRSMKRVFEDSMSQNYPSYIEKQVVAYLHQIFTLETALEQLRETFNLEHRRFLTDTVDIVFKEIFLHDTFLCLRNDRLKLLRTCTVSKPGIGYLNKPTYELTEYPPAYIEYRIKTRGSLGPPKTRHVRVDFNITWRYVQEGGNDTYAKFEIKKDDECIIRDRGDLTYLRNMIPEECRYLVPEINGAACLPDFKVAVRERRRQCVMDACRRYGHGNTLSLLTPCAYQWVSERVNPLFWCVNDALRV
jgi:hypothetical protein